MTMNKSNKDATCLVKMFNSPSLENSMVFAYPSATAESVHMRGQEKISYFIMVCHNNYLEFENGIQRSKDLTFRGLADVRPGDHLMSNGMGLSS